MIYTRTAYSLIRLKQTFQSLGTPHMNKDETATDGVNFASFVSPARTVFKSAFFCSVNVRFPLFQLKLCSIHSSSLSSAPFSNPWELFMVVEPYPCSFSSFVASIRTIFHGKLYFLKLNCRASIYMQLTAFYCARRRYIGRISWNIFHPKSIMLVHDDRKV